MTGPVLAAEDLRDLVMLEVHDRLPDAGAIAVRCVDSDATHLRVGITVQVSMRISDESTTSEALPSNIGRQVAGMIERELFDAAKAAQADRDRAYQRAIARAILRTTAVPQLQPQTGLGRIVDQLSSGTLEVTL